jgi:hypothetical protein
LHVLADDVGYGWGTVLSEERGMAPRNIDARLVDDLSYRCSRRYEDYLDWLENQRRPSQGLFSALRKLAGAMVEMGALAGAAILNF